MTGRVFRAPMVGGAHRALDVGICGMTADDERAVRRLERFADVPDGSLVWTRDADGEYFVGRLEGPLRHDESAEALAAGLTDIRPCAWTEDPVPEHQVPAATLRTFARGGRNFQETHDPEVWAQSLEVWRRRGR